MVDHDGVGLSITQKNRELPTQFKIQRRIEHTSALPIVAGLASIVPRQKPTRLGQRASNRAG